MVLPFKLTGGPHNPESREQTLARVRRFKEAQRKLEETCAEKGIPVPVMIC